MPDKNNIQPIKGLDNSTADISNTLENNQDQFNTNINQGRYIPDVITPSTLKSPSLEDKEPKSSFLDDASNTFADKSSTTSTKRNANVFGEQIQKDFYTGKYPNYGIGLDNEDVAAQKQSGLQKAEYAVPRILGTFTKTVVQGITAPLVGLGYLFTGGNFIENDYNKWLESYESAVDKALPLYESKAEKNTSFLGQLKYGNSYVHLAEFIAMGAGLAATAAMTAGLGEAVIGASLTRAITPEFIQSIDKLSEVSATLSELDNAQPITKELLERANTIFTKTIPEGQKLSELNASIKEISDKYTKISEGFNSVKQKVYGAASLMGMNAGMGAKANNDFSASMRQAYIDKNGVEPTDEEQSKIDEMSTQVGKWTFGVGTALSTLSLAGMFKSVLAKGEVEDLLREQTEGIVEKEGAKVGEGQYEAKSLPFEGAKSKFGKITQSIGNRGYKVGKFAGKVFDPWAGLSLAEFSIMGPSVENYFNKKYKTGQADVIEDAIGPNVEKIFTKEGLSTFFMGMLGSAPMEAGRKFSEGKEAKMNAKTAIDLFNKNTANSYLGKNIESIIRGKSLRDDKVSAIAEGDKLSEYNIRQAELLNYIYPRIRFGMKSLISKDIEGLRNQASTDEGLKELQKNKTIPADGDLKELKTKFLAHLDHMEKTANDADIYYKALTLKYGRNNQFKDIHIEKLVYLSGMTDDATDRIKTLSKELSEDKRLQDIVYSVNYNSFSTKLTNEEITPSLDIPQLLGAESRSTVIREQEGRKKYLAEDLYNNLHNKIDNLSIVEDQKQDLKNKLDDMVSLNFLRRNYLKQYQDILRDPKKHEEKTTSNLINPYTTDYEGKEEVKDYIPDNTYELETKAGKTALSEGEEYYSGSPIVISNNGIDEGFRKFKIVKELPDDQILIKTDKGSLIPVDKDFLKKHDIGRTRDIKDSSQARFYDRNKLKRIVKDVKNTKKETKRSEVEAKQSSLQEEHEWAVQESYEAHNDQYRAKQEEVNQLKKSLQKLNNIISQSPQKGMGAQREDLIRDLKTATDDLQDIIRSKQSEKDRIDKFYNGEQDRLAEIQKELDRDPKEYLDNKAKASYAVALDKIEAEHKEDLSKLKDKLEQYPTTDIDFEKDRLQKKKDDKIASLKTQYRDLYDKRLKELQNSGKESGTLEYSPSKDQLHFVNKDREETPIGTKELKEGDIQKIDGSDWDAEDKKFIDSYQDEKIKKAEVEFFAKQGDILTKEQDRISRLYDASEVPTPEVTESDKTSFATQVKGGQTKMSLNTFVSSSLSMDKNSEFFKNASPKVKEWLSRHNNWADRVNSFLDNVNLNSFKKNSDLKDENGQYKQPSIIYVHDKNQAGLGLSGLIQSSDTEGRSEIDTPLLMVMVHTDEKEQKWTVDNQGKKLKKVGDVHSPEDYKKMIWTIKRAATNKWSNGEIGYRIEEGEDEKSLLESAVKERKGILSSITPVERTFNIEGGNFVDRYQKNESIPLQDSGLGTKEDIIPDSIEVTTLGTDGKGRIIVGEGGDTKTYQVKPGIPFLKKGKTLIMLNSKKFTNKNKQLIYDSIINLVKDFHINKSIDTRITDFLGTIMHYSNRFIHNDKENPEKFLRDKEGFPILKSRQLSYWFNKIDKKGYLLLGKDSGTIHLEFTPQNLEDNEKEIKDWLGEVHHVASKKGLQSTKDYFEITGYDTNTKEKTIIDDKEVEVEKLNPIMTKWDNYTQYLSSKTTPEGKIRDAMEIPLTSNVKRPEDGSSSIKGKYITTYTDVKEKPITKKVEVAKDEEKSIEVVKSGIKVDIAAGDKQYGVDLDGTENSIVPHESIGEVKYTASLDKNNIVVVDINSLSGTKVEEINTPAPTGDIEDLKDIAIKKAADTLKEGQKETIASLKTRLEEKIQVEVDKKLGELAQQQAEVKRIKDELDAMESEESFNPKESEIVKTTTDREKAVLSALENKDQKKNLSKKVVDMETSPLEHNIPIENVIGFKEWLKSVLPQFDVNHLPEMIKNGKGGFSWGQYDHAYKTISLSSNVIIGTGFHEAFHAVFDSFLSAKQQLDLISEFRNREGKYIDRFGQEHNFSDVHTDDEVIEQIADEFREHQLTNKVYEKSPEKMGFFTRLKNFIKHIILGKPETIKGIFDKINGSYYKDSSIYDKSIPVRDMTIFPDGRTAKQNVIRDISDGFIVSLRSYLGVKNGELIGFSEGTVKANDVFNKIKKDLNEKLINAGKEQINDRDITASELSDFYNSMEFLTDYVTNKEGKTHAVINDKNWQHLIDTKIKDRLKLFKVSIEKEYDENTESTSPEGISVPVEESNTNSKNTWGIDIFKSDAKDTAPREIQFLFNTILQTIDESVPGYNDSLQEADKKVNSLLLNKIVEDNSLFYKTMHSLSGLSSLDEMENKFKELAKTIPALRDPYISLFGTSKEDRNDNQWRFAMMFHKAFAKQSPDVIMGFRDSSGLSYTGDANSAKASDEIQRDWQSNFKNNKELSTIFTKKTEDGKKESSYYIINPNMKLTEPKTGKTERKTQFKFLDEIGFTDITEDNLDALSNSKEDIKLKNDFSKALSNLYLNMKNLQTKGLPIVGRDVFGSGGAVRKLSEIAAKIAKDKFASQYQRGDGEYVQNNILHNEYSLVLSRINEAKTLDQFFDKFPTYRDDPYMNNSLLLKKGGNFFDEEGNIREGVKLTVNTGVRNEDGSFTLSEDMTGVQRMMHTLNINLKANKEGSGFFHVFMPADQSTDFGMQMDYYIDLANFKAGQGTHKFNEIFRGYLEDEINTIKDKEQSIIYKDLAKSVEDKVNGISKRPRAEQLRYFKNILSPEMVRAITEYANKEALYEDTELSYKDLLETPWESDKINGKVLKTFGQKLNEDIGKYIDTELGREIYFLRDNLVISEIKPNVFKFNGINTDVLKTFGHISNELSYAEVKNILKFRMFNTKINSVEFSKLFYGDPAIHKDFLKRAKLLNSGTEVNYMDTDGKGYNKFANTEKNKVGKILMKVSDWGYHTFSNTMKGFTFDHGDSKSTMIIPSNIEELKEIFKDNPDAKAIIDKYEKTNGIDAQSYSTISLMRELGIKGGGTWTAEHEKAYQYSKAAESLDLQKRLDAKEVGLAEKLGRDSIYSDDQHGKDLKAQHEELVKDKPKTRGIFNIIKYLGAGNAVNDNKLVPNKLKTSTLPLYYELVKGTKLEDLYFFLMKNGLHYTGPESQHKEGVKQYNKEQSSPSLYNTSEYEKIGNLNIHDLPKEEIERLSYEQPMDQFNKIVETAGNHKTTSLGTQLRVLSTMDLMDNGMPKDFYDGDKHEFWQKQEEWNNLKTEAEKRKASPLYSIYKDIDNILSGMIKQGGSRIQEVLGIGTKDGKPYLKDSKTFINYVKEMCNTYNIPANIKDALKITKDRDGNDTVLIDQLPNRDSLEYIINSVIEREVVRPKENGGSKILVSGEMFEANNRQAMYKNTEGKWETITSKEQFDKLMSEGAKIQLTSNDLKTYSRDKDGNKVNGMEVKINNHFKEKMEKWFEKAGKEIPSNEELLKYLNNTEEGKSLLRGVGFRIPTQGLNSIDAFTIKGFVDDRLGDAVVVPSEITTKVGSDFDVDKLNTYLQNFYLDEKTGMPKKIEFFNTINEDTLEKIWEQKKAISKQSIEEIPEGDASDVAGDLMSNTGKALRKAGDKAGKELADLEAFISENIGKSPYEVNSTEALHNQYFELLQKSILHEANTERLLTPNTTDDMLAIEKKISTIKHINEEKDDNINYANNLDTLWVNRKRQEMLEGKQGTSIFASGNTSHAMMQNLPVHLREGLSIKLSHKQVSIKNTNGDIVKVTSLANIKNAAGKFISDMISQGINGTVDVAANAWLMRMLPSKSLFSQTLFLLRAGVDAEETFFFLNQPIIQEYIKAFDKNKNLSDDEKENRKDIKGRILKQFGKGELTKLDKFPLSDMQQAMEDWHKFNENGNEQHKLSDTQKGMQRQILNEFMTYEDLAGELFTAQTGTYWGNIKKPTDGVVYLKNDAFKKGAESKNLVGIHENLDNTWFGTMKDEITNQSNILNSVIFKTALPLAKEQMESAKHYIAGLRIEGGIDKKISLINKVKSNFLDFLTQNFAKENGEAINTQLRDLFLKEGTNITSKLITIQKKLKSIERKYNKEAKEAKANNQPIPARPDILDNLALKKLGASIRNPNDPHNIEIEAKPTSVNSKEDFTSSLEEIKDHSDPIISNFYNELVKFGILQSGIKGSRISYNDLIPNESYSAYIQQGIDALEDMHSSIRKYDENKVFWRTNWRDNNIVKKIRKNSAIILESGDKVVHLPIYKANSPVVKTVRPISENGVELTPTQIAARKNISRTEELYETELYKRVERFNPQTMKMEPVVSKEKEGKATHYLYKQINPWGDSQYMQESYLEDRQSILEKNKPVMEVSDEEIVELAKLEAPVEQKSNIEQVTGDEITPELQAEMDAYDAELETSKLGEEDIPFSAAWIAKHGNPLTNKDLPDSPCPF